jgi:hypothetical protein
MKKRGSARRKIAGIKSALGSGKKLKVGLLGGHYPDGTSIPLVGFWNEFGTKRSPERPFMRSTLFHNKNYKDTLEKIAKGIVAGKYNKEKAFEMLGQKVKQDIQKTIVELRYPKNAKSTVRAKRSSNPLIDTGIMRSSIDYVIEE